MTACIVGWSHTPFGKHEAADTESLILDVATQAVEDAGIGPQDIDEIVVGNFNEGFSEQSFPSSLVLQADPRFRFTPATRVENACATGSAAIHQGLKSIEARLGVGRPTSLTALSGYDAVTLWRRWTRGDHAARETLIRYNAEDVASLPALAEIAYNRLSERLPVPCEPLTPLHRHDIDLPFDENVIAEITASRRPSWLST